MLIVCWWCVVFIIVFEVEIEKQHINTGSIWWAVQQWSIWWTMVAMKTQMWFKYKKVSTQYNWVQTSWIHHLESNMSRNFEYWCEKRYIDQKYQWLESWRYNTDLRLCKMSRDKSITIPDHISLWMPNSRHLHIGYIE